MFIEKYYKMKACLDFVGFKSLQKPPCNLSIFTHKPILNTKSDDSEIAISQINIPDCGESVCTELEGGLHIFGSDNASQIMTVTE